MAHTYVAMYFHCVFSTKHRSRVILPAWREDLWAYIGGIARSHRMRALAVGGVEDHVHALLSLPSTLPLANAVQIVKGGSSRWIHQTFPHLRRFAWQEGYGAFTIGEPDIGATVAYIRSQDEHHRRVSFEAEYVDLLNEHGIAYDERYLWD